MPAETRHHENGHPAPHVRLMGGAAETLGWVAIGLVMAAFVAAIALAAFDYQPAGEHWPVADAVAVRTRVVRGEMPRARDRGPVVVYSGEVLLSYSVRGREYMIWANAGVRDPDAGWVAKNIPDSGYFVRYDPKDPSRAVGRKR